MKFHAFGIVSLALLAAGSALGPLGPATAVQILDGSGVPKTSGELER